MRESARLSNPHTFVNRLSIANWLTTLQIQWPSHRILHQQVGASSEKRAPATSEDPSFGMLQVIAPATGDVWSDDQLNAISGRPVRGCSRTSASTSYTSATSCDVTMSSTLPTLCTRASFITIT